MGPVDDHHDYIYKRLEDCDKKIERLENKIESLNGMFSELAEHVLGVAARITRLERATQMMG